MENIIDCKHKIGVQIHSGDSPYKCNEIYCLKCNENFNGPNIIFGRRFIDLLPFENIINYENLKDIKDDDKILLANSVLEQLKLKYPNLSESQLVDIVNIHQMIKCSKSKQKVKTKTL